MGYNDRNLPPGLTERDLPQPDFAEPEPVREFDPIVTPYDDDMEEFRERARYAATWDGR